MKGKKDIALDIVNRLIDNGLINLEYDIKDFSLGKEECANLIVSQVLSNFIIVEGTVIE